MTSMASTKKCGLGRGALGQASACLREAKAFMGYAYDKMFSNDIGDWGALNSVQKP